MLLLVSSVVISRYSIKLNISVDPTRKEWLGRVVDEFSLWNVNPRTFRENAYDFDRLSTRRN